MTKPLCDKCKGSGFTKNKNFSCSECDGRKCNNTLFKSQYYPYFECTKCFSKGNVIIDNLVITCDLCNGVGLVKNINNNCDECETPHKLCFCNCYIQPFTICDDCNGTGNVIESYK